jgi:hypothetical protein
MCLEIKIILSINRCLQHTQKEGNFLKESGGSHMKSKRREPQKTLSFFLCTESLHPPTFAFEFSASSS